MLIVFLYVFCQTAYANTILINAYAIYSLHAEKETEKETS